jgi:hypothetical protein
MPRLFAIEWDAAEARVATGRPRAGGGLILEQAFTVDLPRQASGGAEPSAKEIGERIARALAERGLSRGDALVAVGRTSIELRFLTLPPMPPEELRFGRLQAVRQFSGLGDDWPLDFVPPDANKDGGTNVLAAAISPGCEADAGTARQRAHILAPGSPLPRCLRQKLAVDGAPADD